MFKLFKEPVANKLGTLVVIFILCFAGIMLTDFIIGKLVIGENIPFTSLESKTSVFIYQKQQIGFIIKLTIGFAGSICFLYISKQIVATITGLEKVQKTLEDQNDQITIKSDELSRVMQQFEEQNAVFEKSQKELKAKEIDQRIIFDNSPLGIIRYDEQGEIKECNDKFVKLMGSTREQLIGFSTAKNSSSVMKKALNKALNGELVNIEDRYTSITGNKTLDLRVIFNPVTPQNLPTPVIASVEDITKRKNAETQLQKSYSELEDIIQAKTSELVNEIEDRKAAHDALLKSEEKYRSILESMQDAYFELDSKGRLIFFNNSLRELLGYTEEEVGDLTYEDIIDKAEQKRIFQTFNKVYVTGQTSQLVYFICIAKGGVRKNVGIIVSLMKNKKRKPIGFQGLARDVTEQHRMEKTIQQTQKMEAIGHLAGGIAHDFNNILGGIIGYTQLIKTHTLEQSKIQGYVEHVMKASERATELVKQILLFSRETESEKKPCDLAQVAREVIKLLRASIPSTIEIKHRFKKELSPVLADPTQIHQVFMNLCSNASYAMKEKGGSLKLNLIDVLITEKTRKNSPELKCGEYIKLSVSDNGMGMKKKVLDKIFDPYFTTKEIGSGTGLGLATVHGIVKNHHGIIQVESKIGVGTQFHLFFPVVKKEIDENEDLAEVPQGTENILFVDDEEYLARVGKEMLEDYGYSVESVTSSKKALKLFTKNPDRFDLVITDYTMPEMTGDKLIREIRSISATIPIIMCTGISIDSENLENLELAKLLIKPLDMDDMLRNIREVLDET